MEHLRKEASPSDSSSCVVSTPDDRGQEAKPSFRIDLNLATSDCDGGQLDQEELNLIDSLNSTDGAEQRVFSCNYCQRKFYSSQALGGHQNAHKRERTLAKRGQRIGAHMAAASAAAFGHPYFHHGSRYSSLASLPLNGAYGRSLGIQVHSMIHKPNNPHISYGRHSWSRPPIDQQPAVGRLSAAENSTSRASVGRFNVMRTMTGGSPADEVMDNCWWSGGTSLNSKQEDQIHKVDLSLKL
ncbi:hypothetical protein GQ457_08G004270 [Hibiscus cannabinus]